MSLIDGRHYYAVFGGSTPEEKWNGMRNLMTYAIGASSKTAIYYHGDELFQRLKSNYSYRLTENGCPSHAAVFIYDSQISGSGDGELKFPNTLALVDDETEPVLPADLELLINLDGLRALNNVEVYRQRVKGHPNLVVFNLIDESEGNIEALRIRFAQCHAAMLKPFPLDREKMLSLFFKLWPSSEGDDIIF